MRNPQYVFTLSDPNPHDNKTRCAIIISLSQKVLERKQEHAIGYRIYEVKLLILRIFYHICNFSFHQVCSNLMLELLLPNNMLVKQTNMWTWERSARGSVFLQEDMLSYQQHFTLERRESSWSDCSLRNTGGTQTRLTGIHMYRGRELVDFNWKMLTISK